MALDLYWCRPTLGHIAISAGGGGGGSGAVSCSKVSSEPPHMFATCMWVYMSLDGSKRSYCLSVDISQIFLTLNP